MMLTNNTLKLERRIAKLTSRSDAIAVGRAAWGLFVILSIWKVTCKSQKIALPSFVCQSVLAAILLAGWEPEFCDIDLTTGNVSNLEWLRIIELGVDAILFVNLFGNVGDAFYIAEACRAKGIYFIEDAAQSFGGSWEDKPSGTFGNASIISFGHTKLIDVGQGGMVLTNDSVFANAIRNFKGNRLPIPNSSITSKKFKEMFYEARHQLVISPELAKESFKGLIDIYQPLISSTWNPEASEKILIQLDYLDIAVRKRREKNLICKEALHDTALVPLSMSEGSVPWRAVFRLPGIGWIEQKTISEAVRTEVVDISNWYIPSHWLMTGFSDSAAKLISTERLSQEIFQLWIDDGTDEKSLKRAAAVLTLKLMELGYA